MCRVVVMVGNLRARNKDARATFIAQQPNGTSAPLLSETARQLLKDGRRLRLWMATALCICAPLVGFGERINHEGRILGPLPVITGPILFNTAEADAIVSAMQIYPADNAWNEDVSDYPLLPNSAAMIAQVTADLAANRRTFRPFFEMNFVLIPDNQPLVPIDFFNYPDESDPSPYPIPTNMPVEPWPSETGSLTLEAWQEDSAEGDRHSIIVQPSSNFIWETD